MADSFIVPLTSIVNDNNFVRNAQQPAAQVPFGDVFHNLIDNVSATDAAAKQGAIEAVSGESSIDRLHELTIASTKSEMALKLFVQLRNKGHEAYSEIMRMGV